MHQLQKENPDKTFIPVSDKLICHDMKYITLKDIFDSLTEVKYVVKVPDNIRIAANKALNRMLELS